MQLPELETLERIAQAGTPGLDVRVACEVEGPDGQRLPVYVFGLGTRERGAPAVGFFGGVHGLERIGAQVVVAHLQSIVMRLRWDVVLQHQLQHVRLVFMPLVNPGGMASATRANPRGVDLMRNAPISASAGAAPLVGGQRLSARLPWYRGPAGQAMETESRALCDLVLDELIARPFALAIDCHSGFGARDRIWFPFAHTRQPFQHLAEMHALHEIFEQAYSHHAYLIEPQSAHYLAHGDLWDYLYTRALDAGNMPFLPLTLEMGSWLWIRKNPRQLFTRDGLFNPLLGHRQQRVLRRHLSLLDFLGRATASHAHWRPDPQTASRHRADAIRRWYPTP